MKKIDIAVPSYGQIDSELVEALCHTFKTAREKNYDLTLRQLSGCCYLPLARSQLVAEFLDGRAEELLFVDADVIPTPEDFFKIFEHDVDVVVGAYPKKSDDSPLDKKFSNQIVFLEGHEPDETSGLLPVARGVTGFMKIYRGVLDKLIDEHPERNISRCTRTGRQLNMVFDTGFHEESIKPSTIKAFSHWWGEDFLFCERVREMGLTVFLDTRISLGHAGRKVWKVEL